MNWLAEVWLLYAATCSAAGWLFSLFRFLNAPAYLILHIFFFFSIFLLYRFQLKHLFRLRSVHKIKPRFLIVREITPKDNLASLQSRGQHYIFSGERGLRENRSQTIEEWATDLHASCRPEVLDLIVFP